MPASAIVFDCEFLTAEGAMRRFWAGPHDPDPLVAQIGAVKLSLGADCDVIDTLKLHIRPVDRFGKETRLDPYFTELTGVTEAVLSDCGMPLQKALAKLDAFAEGDDFWSWGKDELYLLGISCYVAGITAPIPSRRFHNACRLLLKAGMPYDDLQRTSSGGLADYYGLDSHPARRHDGLDDALSIARVLQHLLRSGKLSAADFYGV